MSRPYLVRNGKRNPLHLAQYKSCIKGHRVTTPEPGFYPSFGGALAWLRAHKKEIATAVNLLRMYPETIEDMSLDPVWCYLEPLIEAKVQSQYPPGYEGWRSGRRRSKSAGDGSFTTSLENSPASKTTSTNSRICKLPPLAATRYQAQFNSISCKNTTSNTQNIHQDIQGKSAEDNFAFSHEQSVKAGEEDLSPSNGSADVLSNSDSSTRRQLFMLWRPQGGKIVHWPPQSGEISKGSWCSSMEDSDIPFLPEHDIILNKHSSFISYSMDSMDNWCTGTGHSFHKSQVNSTCIEETSSNTQDKCKSNSQHHDGN